MIYSSVDNLVFIMVLLQNLAFYGFSDSAPSWFINNQTQQVSYDGHFSSSGFFQVWILQGSILGLLLFPFTSITCQVLYVCWNMYAYDTELHFSHSDLSVALTNCIWLIVNRLRMNVMWSDYACWLTKDRISKWYCFEVGKHCWKYLGLTIPWQTSHLQLQLAGYILSILRKKLCAVNRVEPASSWVLQLLYQAYILPVLDCVVTIKLD